MTRWPSTLLGDVATIDRSGVDPLDIQHGETYVGLENISSGGGFTNVQTVSAGELGSTKFRFSNEHVLFGKLRPYLAKIEAPSFGGVCSTDILPIRPSDRLDRRYLLHFLRLPSQVELAARRSAGANLPRLSPRELEKFEIPLPPLPEQRRIAAILDHADALRAKRRQVLGHLDSLIESVFYDMFGDPVQNPKRWKPRTLGEEAKAMQYGPRFYNEPYSEDGTRIVRITDLHSSGRLDFEAMPRMAVSEVDRRKYGLTPGDIVFARTGATVGKIAVIQECDPLCIAGAYFIRISLKDDVLAEYVASALRTKSIQSIIWTQSHQSAQQNFSGPGLRALPMPVPPVELQREFIARLKRINTQRFVADHASQSDDELFASLESRAFRGDL